MATHGHDIHFLERLERLSTPQTELALSLYRDPDLVRAILDHASLADNIHRVAVSLEDDRCGPFLVVARNGHFVTCLGEGMSPGQLPVLTRGQLDGISRRVEELRERIENARLLAGTRGGIVPLLDRIFVAGPWLSREEFMAIAAFQPLLKDDFLQLLMLVNADMDRQRKIALRSSRRGKGSKRLKQAWNLLWSLQHLTILATMDSRDVFSEPPSGLADIGGMISWPTVRQGVHCIALRGAWGVAKVGKLLLPEYKDWYRSAESPLDFLDSALGLLALGLRHKRLAAEVQKTLRSRNIECVKEGPEGETMRRCQNLFLECADLVFDRPDVCDNIQVGFGRCMIRPRDDQAGDNEIADDNEISDEIARLVAASWQGGFIADASSLVLFIACLPWVARARSEDLYWPGDVLEVMPTRWKPGKAARLLEYGQVVNPPEEPVRTTPKPGRNEPCPCGSGRKWKRCHGA